MQILTVASQKGGSGKTTLAGHLAVQAENAGAGPVAVLDTDPQASLSDWWEERQTWEEYANKAPTLIQTTQLRFNIDVERARDSGYALLIIDTPPAITNTISRVVGISDLVVIPTRPSPHDLRSAGRTVEIVREGDKPMVFVINGASSWAKITSEAVIALSQHGTLAPTILHQRSDFAASMIDGRTVMEIPRRSRSAQEIAGLWAYLKNRLDRNYSVTLLPKSRTALQEHRRANAE